MFALLSIACLIILFHAFRFYSMVVNGDLELPCRAKMVQVALDDKVNLSES